MHADRPFKVINCLSQGFAVAGPVVEGVRRSEVGDREAGMNPDLEMVLWGVSFAKAREMAEGLNQEAAAATERRPQHTRD